MDVALEPGCPNRRAHPRWMQHRGHLRDAVVPGSRAQAPPANVTETYAMQLRAWDQIDLSILAILVPIWVRNQGSTYSCS